MNGKTISAVVALAAVALILTFFSNNAEHTVSFAVCSASIDKHKDGSQTMSVETSAGRFLAVDPTVIRVLGGDKLKINQKFDGRYVGSNPRQLKQVSPAENLDKVAACK